MASLKKLLFIDTNIWLDFYRVRNDAGLKLLEHAEKVADRIVVNFQLEAEYKKNRQVAILEGINELKAPQGIPRPGIFSNSKETATITKNVKAAGDRVKKLKERMVKVLNEPAIHDPVYKVCQRIFHKSDSLNLGRDHEKKVVIRRKALRRFLHGCPPRKKNDTSYGDAFNWEWMVHCATEEHAELVIVSRDSDYGVEFDGKTYANDHLRQEFAERVSQKRKLLLYTRLSEALKHFSIPVTPQEVQAEKEIAAEKMPSQNREAEWRDPWKASVEHFRKVIMERFLNESREVEEE